jgi:hypothetical protein
MDLVNVGIETGKGPSTDRRKTHGVVGMKAQTLRGIFGSGVGRNQELPIRCAGQNHLADGSERSAASGAIARPSGPVHERPDFFFHLMDPLPSPFDLGIEPNVMTAAQAP